MTMNKNAIDQKQMLLQAILMRKQLSAMNNDENKGFADSWQLLLTLLPDAVALKKDGREWSYQQLDSEISGFRQVVSQFPEPVEACCLSGSDISQLLPVCLALWLENKAISLVLDSELPENELVLSSKGINAQALAPLIESNCESVRRVKTKSLNEHTGEIGIKYYHGRCRRLIKVLGSKYGRHYALSPQQGGDLNTLTCLIALLSGSTVVQRSIDVNDNDSLQEVDFLLLPDQQFNKLKYPEVRQSNYPQIISFGISHDSQLRETFLSKGIDVWQVLQVPELNMEFSVNKYSLEDKSGQLLSTNEVLISHAVVDAAGVPQPEAVTGSLALKFTPKQVDSQSFGLDLAANEKGEFWFTSALQGRMCSKRMQSKDGSVEDKQTFVSLSWNINWHKGTNWLSLPDMQSALHCSAFVRELQLVSVTETLGRQRLLAFYTVESLDRVREVHHLLSAWNTEHKTEILAVHRLNLPRNREGQIDISMLLAQGTPELAAEGLGLPESLSSDIDINNTRIEFKQLAFDGVSKVRCNKLDPTVEEKPESSVDRTTEQPLSLLTGAAFDKRKAHKSLADALRETAEEYPNHKLHFLSQHKHITIDYQGLLNRAQLRAKALKQVGITPRQWVILNISDVEAFVVTFWACQLLGLVCVPQKADPLLRAKKNLDSLLNLAERTNVAWILSDNSEIQEVFSTPHKLAQGRNNPSLQLLLVGDIADPQEHSDAADLECHFSGIEISPDSIALVLQTSGSTSQPKLVQQSHCNIIARSLSDSRFNEFTPDDCSFNWMPLDHVGGLVMFHIRDIVTGCHQIQGDNTWILSQPERCLEIISQQKVSITWGPNFVFALLLDRLNSIGLEAAQNRYDLTSLKFILNGGEAISPDITAKFMAMATQLGCPSDAMNPAWGMSETCSGVLYHHKLDFHALSTENSVSLGWPISGINIRISSLDGETVPKGVVGRLHVQGICVSPGYLDEKDNEVFDSEGWLETGDLALIDHQGGRIVGRSKDSIIINGINFSCQQLESIVAELPGLAPAHTCAVGFRTRSGATEQVALFVNIADTAIQKETIRNIKSKFKSTLALSVCVLPVEPEVIERTNIGKVKRGLMQQKLQNGDFDQLINTFNPDALKDTEQLLPAWFFKKTRQLLPSATTGNSSISKSCLSVINSDSPWCESLIQYLGDTSKTAFNFEIKAVKSCEIEKAQHLVLFSDSTEQADIQLINLLPQVRLNTVSRFSLVYQGEELNKAAVAAKALLQTLAREMPEKAFRFIHLTNIQPETLEQFASQLDYRSPVSVTIKQSETYYNSLLPFDFSDVSDNSLTLQPGCYLISGGLGTLGLQLAEWLTQHFSVSLCLLGRRSEEQLERTTGWQKMLDLRSRGYDVNYLQVDITSVELESVIRQQITQPIAGIFHLAAEYVGTQIVDLSEKEYDQVISAKSSGTENLLSLLRTSEIEGPLFVSFGSVNSFFGGVGAGAYGAACAVQEHLTNASDANIHSYYIAWSQWQSGGLLAESDLAAVAKYRGFSSIERQQGLDSLGRILTALPGTYLVGLDASHQEILNQCQWPVTDPILRVNYQLKDKASLASLPAKGLDRLGNNFAVAFKSDIKLGLGQQSSKYLAVQERVVDIWRNILNSEDVDIYQNLFESGGSSIKLLQLKGELDREFECNIEVTEIFDNASIAMLSRFLYEATAHSGGEPGPASKVKEEVSARDSERMDKRRQRRGNQRRSR